MINPNTEAVDVMPDFTDLDRNVCAKCCRNAAVASISGNNWRRIALNSEMDHDRLPHAAAAQYAPDTLSKGLPRLAQVARPSGTGNVTATHDLSPISAALIA